MRPRATPPPKVSSFYPPNDPSTYRDLLLFEERLKSTAASLQSRKSRYQLFLIQLLLFIAFFLTEVILPPHASLLAIPCKLVLTFVLPNIYTPETELRLHPYIGSGLLLIGVTTLALFFASGMYTEKIAYANKYVPHANRSLRSFNMYLNVRKPPLRSKFFSPMSFFFPRESAGESPAASDSRATSPRRPFPSVKSTAVPISPIPPSSNPRGEIIFSSRVDRNFRESYERYRAAFERKRQERERMENSSRWLDRIMFWRPIPPVHKRVVSNSATSRGRISRSGTPPTSARLQSSSSPGSPPASPVPTSSKSKLRERA
ncbi:hypothetical protein C8J56DRAFT_820476 [Mycena floridula]|nr:hypothetical protein C8J56DRAFT_820476 [Mycena floridula]